jgi:hypothetical protein
VRFEQRRKGTRVVRGRGTDPEVGDLVLKDASSEGEHAMDDLLELRNGTEERSENDES